MVRDIKEQPVVCVQKYTQSLIKLSLIIPENNGKPMDIR
jgi:hypothetical protein